VSTVPQERQERMVVARIGTGRGESEEVAEPATQPAEPATQPAAPVAERAMAPLARQEAARPELAGPAVARRVGAAWAVRVEAAEAAELLVLGTAEEESLVPVDLEVRVLVDPEGPVRAVRVEAVELEAPRAALRPAEAVGSVVPRPPERDRAAIPAAAAISMPPRQGASSPRGVSLWVS
jgi:hypothetical protein